MRLSGVVALVVAATGMLALTTAGPAFATSEPVLISPPTISGVAQVGKVLTTEDSVWAIEGFRMGPSSRVWDRCTGPALSDCKAITDAGGSYENLTTYQVTSADLGATIRVWNGLTTSEWQASVSSAPTAVVTAATPPSGTKPRNTVRPRIKGRAEVGTRLTAARGRWAGTAPIAYRYRWQRCNRKGRKCRAIKGATRRFFTPGKKYLGTRLRVAVTASNSSGRATATSKASKVVGA